MFESIGTRVTYLKRIAMGKLFLPKDLVEGKYIKVTKDELYKMIYGE